MHNKKLITQIPVKEVLLITQNVHFQYYHVYHFIFEICFVSVVSQIEFMFSFFIVLISYTIICHASCEVE